MSVQLKSGEKKRLELSGVDITGFTFNAYAVGKTANTAITNGHVDIDEVTVSATLFQGGKETTLFSGQLLPLVLESSFAESEWANADPNASAVAYHELVAAASGVKTEQLHTYGIDLGGIINLRGTDKLLLEIRVNSTAFGSTVDSSLSYFDVDSIEGIGLQYTTPQINQVAIGNGESTFRHAMGENVTSVTFINTDKAGITSANKVINNVRLFSDRFDINDDYHQLLNKRCAQLPTRAEADSRAQSFLLFGGECDKARIEFDLNSSNVNTSENYVIYRSYETGRSLVSKAQMRAEKHHAKRMKKVAKNK
jgi:hypothetical protein